MTEPKRPYPSATEPVRKTDWRKYEKRRASVMVGVRFTPDEADELRARAAESGCSLPEYLRRCADAVAYLDALQEAHRGDI